jgi:hypothetical protein
VLKALSLDADIRALRVPDRRFDAFDQEPVVLAALPRLTVARCVEVEVGTNLRSRPIAWCKTAADGTK